MSKLKFGSLFAGIGGFDLGFERAGMSCEWQVEIEKSCRAVLASRFESQQFEDVSLVGANELSRVDVICGGFPCQDLSVAGRRSGLSGERSGLFFEFMRIVDELSPRWVCAENVPGLLSSWSGETPDAMGERPGPGREMELEETSDFSTVLSTLRELGYGTAYRIFDAQWFGVAQRRRRVFIVGCLGDWRSAAEVLFERESLPWDSPPRRKAGADVADPITRSFAKHGGASGGKDSYPRNAVVNCLDSHMGSGGPDDNAAQAGHLLAFGGNNTRGPIEVATCCNAKDSASGRQDFESETFVTHIPILEAGARTGKSTTDPRAGMGVGESGDPMFTLQSGKQHAVAYQCHGSNVGPMGHLRQGNGNETGGVPFVCGTIQSTDGGIGTPDRVGELVPQRYGVRRLTPTECERLQGFPDAWTEGHSDSPRYRMIGNAVAVPCAEWIGRRINKTENSRR